MSATPGDLRRLNERAVVDRLLRGRAASRAALAQELGMSAPTAGKVIGELIGRGVIEEVEGEGSGAEPGAEPLKRLRLGGGGVGRPGRLLRLESRTPRLVLVQLGVRRTRLAAAALGGGRGDAGRWAASFRTPRSAPAWRRALAEASLQLPIRGRGAWAVVASVPGVVDEAAGRVVYSPNLHWTEGADLAGALQAVWPAPVALVQEIQALALGRHVAGGMGEAGEGVADDFLLVDFGDGVGGAAVVRGRLAEGALPMTGELGHTPVAGNRRRCGCGNVGCLETLVSRRGLLESFAAHFRGRGRGRPRWAALRERVAERGVEPWLSAALGEAGRHVAAALNVLGLRKAVVTGSVVELGEAAVGRLGEAVRGAALWARFGGVECVAAPRRRALGLVAAGLQRVVAPVDERERGLVRPIGAVRLEPRVSAGGRGRSGSLRGAEITKGERRGGGVSGQGELKWEERWHPLREEWVIVAAHRQNRPWSGETLGHDRLDAPAYDPACYLCPGNARVSGKCNPKYAGVYVFDNDHPCVGPDAPARPAAPVDPRGVYRNRPAEGVARVVCYTPRHNVTLAELPAEQIGDLLRAWQEQHRELGARPEVNHVLFFENKGEVVGVSNPHPHCQIYATNFVFKTIENEARASARYLRENGRVLLQDVIEAERADGRRILAENDGAIGFLPYFARYAYETFVAPKRTHASLADLGDEEVRDLAAVLKEVLVRFDNLWRMPFPYVMVLHQAPTDGGAHEGFHFHIEFHPPLRKPNLLKYLAGPEIGGGSFLSDTWSEDKAAELRAVSGTKHYKEAMAAGERG